MEETLTPLLKAVTEGNYIVIFTIIALAIVFNFKHIFSFLDSRKRVKIELIKESLKSPHVDGHSKLYLEGLIETEYFKSITGVSLGKEFREAIIRKFQQGKGELSFRHYKNAIPYLTYVDERLIIKIGFFACLGFIFNFSIGFLAISFGLIFSFYPAIAYFLSDTPVSLHGIASITTMSLIVIAIGFGALVQCVPVISALYVKKALRKAPSPLDPNFSNIRNCFPVLLHKDVDSDYGVTVPDIPGCHSAGSTLDEAMNNVREAINGHLSILAEEGQDIPYGNTLEDHRELASNEGAILGVVDINMTHHLEKKRKLPSVSVHHNAQLES